MYLMCKNHKTVHNDEVFFYKKDKSVERVSVCVPTKQEGDDN